MKNFLPFFPKHNVLLQAALEAVKIQSYRSNYSKQRKQEEQEEPEAFEK